MAANIERTLDAGTWTILASDIRDEHGALADKIDAAAFDARACDDVRILFGNKQVAVVDAWMDERPAEETAEETTTRRCECGCGETVAKRSSFRQGHDQRLKGTLLRLVDACDANAAAELVDRGWRTSGEVTARLAKAVRKAAEQEAEAA
jgi:hypothetical protein